MKTRPADTLVSEYNIQTRDRPQFLGIKWISLNILFISVGHHPNIPFAKSVFRKAVINYVCSETRGIPKVFLIDIRRGR